MLACTFQVMIKLHNDEQQAAVTAAQGVPGEAVWQLSVPGILPAAGVPRDTVLTFEQVCVSCIDVQVMPLCVLYPPGAMSKHCLADACFSQPEMRWRSVKPSWCAVFVAVPDLQWRHRPTAPGGGGAGHVSRAHTASKLSSARHTWPTGLRLEAELPQCLIFFRQVTQDICAVSQGQCAGRLREIVHLEAAAADTL